MKYFLLFILILTIGNSYAQSKEQLTLTIDSLQKVINSQAADTSKLKALKKWDDLIYRDDPALDFEINKQILSLTDSILSHPISSIEETFCFRYKMNAQNVLGMNYFDLGNQKEAFKQYSSSLEIAIKIKDTSGILNVNNNLSNYYYEHGDYDKSIQLLTRSLEIYENRKDSIGIAKMHNNIGIVNDKCENIPKALDHHFKSLEIKKRLGYNRFTGSSYNNIGLIYYRQNNYDLAIKYLDSCMLYYEKGATAFQIASVLNNLATIFLAQDNLDSAKAYYNKSLKIYTDNKNQQGESVVLNNLAKIYTKENQFEQADQNFKKVLDMKKSIQDKEGQINALNNYAIMFLKQKEQANARKLAFESLEIANEIKIKKLQNKASQILIQTFEQKDSIDFRHDLFQKINQNTKDLVFTNFPIQSEKEKELFINPIVKSNEIFFAFALENYKDKPAITEDVFNLVILYKSILLKSSTAIRMSIYNSKDKGLIEQYEHWLKLKKELAKKYLKGGEYMELENEVTALEKQIVQKSNLLNDVSKLQNFNWKDIQNSLKKDEAVIEFIHFDPDLQQSGENVVYCALIVDKKCEYPKIIQLCLEKDLLDIIGQFPGNNKNYVESIYGKKNKLNNKMYNLIWQPIENEIDDLQKVYICPSGLLHKISFDALSLDNKTYLSDKIEIRYNNSSTSILNSNNQEDFSFKKAAIFGGITYSNKSSQREVWPYLEGSAKEAESISKILKSHKKEVDLFMDQIATEEKFREVSNDAEIIHIATHGFFFDNPEKIKNELEINETANITFRGTDYAYAYSKFINTENPLLRSGIVFANANEIWTEEKPLEKDGLLTAEEVSLLNLNQTELVVLSACETGLGDIVGAEGVYGLQRSFKMAGTKNLIMTLWQVPDKESAEFMMLFYKYLAQTNSIEDSFRKAQSKMKKNYDPYYWAAFVLLN
ncbi:CHAT domain-containing protein [Paracrocinitomix mangrovi]|uniref:CHAT domain-containing protein n=1 Tax=Paracrocinitomix mangrovi TaxID=2862509 RepID=UPI001C8E6139|nr:CHAT domain-containing tetratricopeptide repeat protein [Paracrocinitomix mangrovi]UKN00276.1 CHAT domain-containing protein [Paracrocinitomix mangrovi]